MGPRAEIFGRPHQGLEIDMSCDVSLSGIFQGIGEAVAGDGLKRIAGIAAQGTVIDDQRGAVLGTAPAGAARTKGGSRMSKRGIGSGATPNTRLPLTSNSTVRSCQPVSPLTT